LPPRPMPGASPAWISCLTDAPLCCVGVHQGRSDGDSASAWPLRASCWHAEPRHPSCLPGSHPRRGAGALLGVSALGEAGGPATGSHLRYLSGLLMGMGVCASWCAGDLRRRGGAFTALCAIFVLGGAARAWGLVMEGVPPWPHRAALGMELGVVPTLWLVVRRAHGKRAWVWCWWLGCWQRQDPAAAWESAAGSWACSRCSADGVPASQTRRAARHMRHG